MGYFWKVQNGKWRKNSCKNRDILHKVIQTLPGEIYPSLRKSHPLKMPVFLAMPMIWVKAIFLTFSSEVICKFTFNRLI